MYICLTPMTSADRSRSRTAIIARPCLERSRLRAAIATTATKSQIVQKYPGLSVAPPDGVPKKNELKMLVAPVSSRNRIGFCPAPKLSDGSERGLPSPPVNDAQFFTRC